MKTQASSQFTLAGALEAAGALLAVDFSAFGGIFTIGQIDKLDWYVSRVGVDVWINRMCAAVK